VKVRPDVVLFPVMVDRVLTGVSRRCQNDAGRGSEQGV
jgi:hypothetical protein